MDDMTRIELLENLENEWRELETAFRTLESTLKEIQKGKNIIKKQDGKVYLNQ